MRAQLRARSRRSAAPARGQGARDRHRGPGERVAREGDRSALTGSPTDGRGPGATSSASSWGRATSIRTTGAIRTFADRGPGDPYQQALSLRGRIRQPGQVHSSGRKKGHGGCADVSSLIGSAAWTRSRKPSRVRSGRTASHSMPRCKRCGPERPRRHGGLPRHEDWTIASAHRRLRRDVPADVDPSRPRLPAFSGHDGGGARDDSQRQREDGAGDEAPILGGGRPDFRRAPLFRPADWRVLVSLHRVLFPQGRAFCRACTGTAGRTKPT